MTTKTYASNRPRPRTVAEIADEIVADWDDCPDAATELLDSLRLVETVNDRVHDRTAGDLLRDLLRLAKDWPGDTAKRVRHEIRGKLGFA